MLLDNGIMTVYRQENVSQPGDMPQYSWNPVWQSYYGEKTVGVTATILLWRMTIKPTC